MTEKADCTENKNCEKNYSCKKHIKKFPWHSRVEWQNNTIVQECNAFIKHLTKPLTQIIIVFHHCLFNYKKEYIHIFLITAIEWEEEFKSCDMSYYFKAACEPKINTNCIEVEAMSSMATSNDWKYLSIRNPYTNDSEWWWTTMSKCSFQFFSSIFP